MKNFFAQTLVKIMAWVLLAVSIVAWVLLVVSVVVLIVRGATTESVTSKVVFSAALVSTVSAMIAFIMDQIHNEKD